MPNLGTLSILRAGYENGSLPARERPTMLPATAQDSWLNGLVCRTAEGYATSIRRDADSYCERVRAAAKHEAAAARDLANREAALAVACIRAGNAIAGRDVLPTVA